MAVPMGIGNIGLPGIIIKRKFRWTFELYTPCGFVPRHYVKLAARPQLDIDELEVPFLNAVTWFPGRGKWQPITVTYIDTNDFSMTPLWDWITSIYNYQDSVALTQTEKVGWNAVGVLNMLDGCGTIMETWWLGSAWPQSINFGDVDYSNSAEQNIEITLRYSEVKHIGYCSPTGIACNCSGC